MDNTPQKTHPVTYSQDKKRSHSDPQSIPSWEIFFGFAWVFAVWMMIGHGFWLGWQYGVHAISPGDIISLPYSQKITLNAFLITILSISIYILFKSRPKQKNNFSLVKLFRPRRNSTRKD